MDVKVSPTKTNNPSLTSTTASHIENLQALHQTLNEDCSDDFIVENTIKGLAPYFEEADALFFYEKVQGSVKLTAKRIKSEQEFGFGFNGEAAPSLALFEEIASCDYVNRQTISENSIYGELNDSLVAADLQDCLLIPIGIHNNVRAVLVVVSTRLLSLSAELTKGIENTKVLLTNLLLMLQTRNRAKLQAQLQSQLLGFKSFDKTLGEFADLLLSHEDSIFQIQILSIEDEYVSDFHVYGQMVEFEDLIKKNVLSRGKVHISFNKVLKQAVKTKSYIYTEDVSKEPSWPSESYSKTQSILYCPLYRHDGKVIGVFCATSDKVDGFSSSDQRYIRQTMGAVNLAFHSQYQISDLEENVSQLSQLADVSQVFQTTISKHEAQLKSLEAIMQETAASNCYFIKYDKQDKYFTIDARATGKKVSLNCDDKVIPGETILQRHLSMGSNSPLYLVDDAIKIFQPYISLLDIQEDIKEVIVCPLVLEESVVTELAIIATEGSFTASNLSTAKTIMSSYVNCMQRIASTEAAQKEAASYKKLAGFGARIEELQNFDELIDYGIQELMAIFGITDANYYVFDESSEVALNAKGWGTELFSKEIIPFSDSPLLHSVVTKRETLYIQDYPSHEKSLSVLVEKGLRSLVFLPVEYADKIVGCMALHGIDAQLELSESDLDLLRQFLSRLRNALERSDYISQLEKSREDTLRSLGIVLEHRDFETQGHTDRVVTLSRNFAKHLGLSSDIRQELIFGAYLHDIGKLVIPDRILLKPGKLTDEEFDEIKTHSVHGYEMAKNIPLLSEASSLLVRHHHEQWLGKGYPDKLQGDEIPFLARMFTLVDVYDALRSQRPYKKPWTKEECFLELREKSGIMFDPELVEDFISVADDFDHAYREHNTVQENKQLFKQRQDLMAN